MTVDTQKLRETATTAVADTLWCTYDCLRVWEAWSVGTMGPDDFSMVVEDEDRLAEITAAALSPALAAIDAQAAEIESLRRVLHDLVSGAGAEMAPGWICNSYHPKLVKALDKARAALSGEPK